MLSRTTVLTVFIVIGALVFTQPGYSNSNYKWGDYTRPIDKRFDNLGMSNPLELEVFLPGNILNANKKIPFIVDWRGDEECSPYISINNSIWARYKLPSKKLVYIKTKHLVPGRNTIKICDDNGYGAFKIYKISFDLSKTTITHEDDSATSEQFPHAKLGDYYALIIGVNDYQWLPKLISAQNDAKAFSNLLSSKYGFIVETLIDANRNDILISLERFRNRLTSKDNFLIYYAGHGWYDQDEEEGYWLPVDASEISRINWISNDSISKMIKAMKAKHVLVIADSCYSGKLARGVNISNRNNRHYARLLNKKARVVLSSGGLEPVVDAGGKEGHSVFASALLDVLSTNKNAMDTTQVFVKLRSKVIINSDQTPEYSDIHDAGHDGGDFIFVPE